MFKKISAALLIGFVLTGGTVEAYDLPKFKPDKKVTVKKTDKPEKQITLKGDWKDADAFEQKIRELLDGKELATDDPARVPGDKNYVFVAFYNDVPFFLDKYSIKIRGTGDGSKVWEQKIFPISKKLSPTNATATHQKFCFADGKFFNALKVKDKDDISATDSHSAKTFLLEIERSRDQEIESKNSSTSVGDFLSRKICLTTKNKLLIMRTT